MEVSIHIGWWIWPVIIELLGIVLGVYVTRLGNDRGDLLYIMTQTLMLFLGIAVWIGFSLAAITMIIGHYI